MDWVVLVPSFLMRQVNLQRFCELSFVIKPVLFLQSGKGPGGWWWALCISVKNRRAVLQAPPVFLQPGKARGRCHLLHAQGLMYFARNLVVRHVLGCFKTLCSHSQLLSRRFGQVNTHAAPGTIQP